ncbi:MAG TPA: hypothetical protein ENI87_02620 [bacterium]|nr:hypothetical protein [bacterium]
MFLPRIFLPNVILAVLLAACGGEERPLLVPAETAQVVAGAGDVDAGAVARVADVVARELPLLRRQLGLARVERFFVHVHESRSAMPESLVAGLHEDAAGFAMLGSHQVHIVWGEVQRLAVRLSGVVRHELVHELLDQLVAPQGRYLPRWFHEGLAQLLAGDTYLSASEDDLVWRLAAGNLPPFGSLERRFPETRFELRSAYAQSYSYVAWLERNYGLPLLLRTARNTDERTSFGRSLVAQTGRSSLQLQDAWRDYVLYGSGASWRVLRENWFGLSMILVLPVLVLALIRRLRREERARRVLEQRARQAQEVDEA